MDCFYGHAVSLCVCRPVIPSSCQIVPARHPKTTRCQCKLVTTLRYDNGNWHLRAPKLGGSAQTLRRERQTRKTIEWIPSLSLAGAPKLCNIADASMRNPHCEVMLSGRTSHTRVESISFFVPNWICRAGPASNCPSSSWVQACSQTFRRDDSRFVHLLFPYLRRVLDSDETTCWNLLVQEPILCYH